MASRLLSTDSALGLFTTPSTAHAWKSLSRDESFCVAALQANDMLLRRQFDRRWQEMDPRHVKRGEFSSWLSYWHGDISMLSLGALLHQSTKVRLFHTLLDIKAVEWEQLRCVRSADNVSLLLNPHWKGTPLAACIPLLKSPYLYRLSHSSLTLNAFVCGILSSILLLSAQ